MHITKLQKKKDKDMAWVDYKKACDMVPHPWIIATMAMVSLSDNIIGLIKQSMKNGKPTYTLMENYCD